MQTATDHTRVQRAVRIAGVIAVLLASIEFTTRLSERIRFGTPLLSPYNAVDELTIRDASGMHGRPLATYRKWSLSDIGLRGPSVTPLPAPGVWRVAVGGASETFGIFESVGHEYPRQLEDSLNARLARRVARCGPQQISRFEVLNLAFLGMSLPTFTQDLAARHGHRGISTLIFYPSPSQYLYDQPPVPALPDSSGHVAALSAWRAIRPRSVSRFRDQFKQLLPAWVSARLRKIGTDREISAHPPSWRLQAIPVDRLERFGDDLRKLVAVIHSIGATPLLVTHVNYFTGATTFDQPTSDTWEKFYPRAPGKILIEFDKAAGDVVLGVARDSTLPVVDLRSKVHGEGPKYFGDAVHFTDTGAAMAANAIAESVENSVLPAANGTCQAPR